MTDAERVGYEAHFQSLHPDVDGNVSGKAVKDVCRHACPVLQVLGRRG